MKKLSPDDPNLLLTLQELPPQFRLAAIEQMQGWDLKFLSVSSLAMQWLCLAMDLDDAPNCPRTNFEFGRITERLDWAARRLEGTVVTPEAVVLSKLRSLEALGPGSRSENAKRNAERNVRVSRLQKLADEIWSRNPKLSSIGVEKTILSKWRSVDGPRPKKDYIRKRIKKGGQA